MSRIVWRQNQAFPAFPMRIVTYASGASTIALQLHRSAPCVTICSE
jgi:hypothetical protein